MYGTNYVNYIINSVIYEDNKNYFFASIVAVLTKVMIIGAFFATLGVVLPSFIIILLIVSIIKNLLKFKGVEAFLRGVRPVVVGLIVAVGITIFLSVVLSFTTINSTVNFDYKSLIIFGLIALINLVYKKITKKKPSVILLIFVSAVLGIIFYGLF